MTFCHRLAKPQRKQASSEVRTAPTTPREPQLMPSLRVARGLVLLYASRVAADVCATTSSCLSNGVGACTINCPPCVYSAGSSITCFDPIATGCPFGAPLAICYSKGIFTNLTPSPTAAVTATSPSPSMTTSTTPMTTTTSKPPAPTVSQPSPSTSSATLASTMPATQIPSTVNQTQANATPAVGNNSTTASRTPPTPSATIFGVIGCAVVTIVLLGCVAYRRNAKQTRNSWTSPTNHPSFLMTMDAPPPPKSGTKASAAANVHQRGLAAPAAVARVDRGDTFTSRSSTSTDLERRESLMSIQSTSSNGYSQSIWGKNKEVVIGSSMSSSVSSVSSIFEIGRQRDRDVLNDSFITSGLIAEEEDDGPWRTTTQEARDSVVIMDDGHEEEDDLFDKSVDDMRETNASVRLFSECSVLSDVSDLPEYGVARI
ncbi:hypothetical protein ACHHYP_04295 [Achlya hypogyna]|uniref:Uncharacterized protein n=1 Tax=Achlya hypogyna TaxID=1202772 RepID=A0A1V9ZPA0_ACHHY|nr:hypothetical protein ACHHYP_04295 [Achlya hypogyna]